MSVILILLTASLTIAIGFLIAFIWSVKNGQYEDDYTPSVRMLFDDTMDENPDGRARDAKGLALFCEGESQTKKAGAIARQKASGFLGENVSKPAARPGAQIKNKTSQ